MTQTPKKSQHKQDSNLGSSALEADALTTRPTRRSSTEENTAAVHRLMMRVSACDLVTDYL